MPLGIMGKKNYDIAGMILEEDGQMYEEKGPSVEIPGLQETAEDLLMAIDSKDPSQVALRLKDAFSLCYRYYKDKEPSGSISVRF